MAVEWRQSTIGDLCSAGIAELQTGPFGSQLHAHDYVEDGIPVVPTEAIRNRQIDHSVLPQISSEKAKELVRHRLRPGDILFARRGVQATGHVGCVRKAEDGYICGTGAIRLRVSKAGGPVDADYLSHVLANPASVEWFKFHAIGATMPNLNEGIIRSFPLAIPPLPERRRIAAILGALDDKIDLNRRMNRTLEDMAQALFKSWFLDFDGHTDLVDSELGMIPRGWRVSEIGSVVKVVGGSTPSTANPLFWEGGVHYWTTPKDLSAATSPLLLNTERLITDAGVASISSGLLPAGTFLLSSRAPIGYTAIARMPVAINQGYIAIPPGGPLSGLFLLHWVRVNLDVIKSRAGGTTFQEISKSNFRPILVAVPPVGSLRRFDEEVGPLFDRIEVNERQTATLAALRDTLLPKLISGEVRVPEAEQAVMEAT